MTKRTTITIAAVAGALLLAATGTAFTLGDDDDRPIRGADLDRARTAALAYTGGGRVTDTEVGDEESYYEVEITLDDGSQLDVQLDRAFHVVGTERDRSDAGAEPDGDNP